jgi:DNA-binding LacI/PurR family transcriptional regulator
MTGEAGGAPEAPRARRMPTMRDIADHVGVSRQLVSLVLRDVPGPSVESRERILRAAAELGYRPNAPARLLRQSRTGMIGVTFEMRNPFQVRFVERLFVRAAEQGYALALEPTTVERSTDEAIAQLMAERVEALAMFNPRASEATIAQARGLLPAVWLGEWAPEAGTDNIHVDETEGLRLAVAHLAELGHRDIAYAGGLGAPVGPDRADAYRAAMAANGLAERIRVVPCDFSEDGGAAAAAAILAAPDRPTAVICCGDQCAAGVLAAFSRAGARVPEDFSVVGFDDSYVAALSYHDLTTVHQDVEATVEATLACILTRFENEDLAPRTIATDTRLVVRTSTGPARTAP